MGRSLGLSPSFHVSTPSLGNLGKSWAFVPQQRQGWQPPPLPQPQEAQETLRKRAEPSLPPGPGLPQSPAGGSVGGRAQATLQPVRAMLSEQLSAETCCSVRPETCVRRGRPPRATDLRKEGHGGAQTGPGPRDVLSSRLVPNCPASLPSSLPHLSRQCLRATSG